MRRSTNFNMKLPEDDDFYNVKDFTDDFEIIDDELKKAGFDQMYGLCNRTTNIGKNAQDQTVITETDSDTSVVATTTIVKTSSTVTTITTVVTDGNDTYTQVTTITKTSSGTTVSESYS